ncbi:MAG: mechanosensitive ion channel domain-containing protein, partial [Bacteroidota bacterium]
MHLTTLPWATFFATALLLFIAYLILRFLQQLVQRSSLFGKYRSTTQRYLYRLLLVFELFVVLVLGASFVLISPLLHGLMIAALFVGAFPHIRNYICGVIIQFDRGVQVGNRLKCSEHSGTIADIKRIGLKLRTTKGMRFVNYSKLLETRYLLLSGEEIGGFYRLQITPQEGN